MELKDCRILITGASAGLGQEFARQLHAQGAHIIVSARRRERLAALCTELCAQRPGSAEFYTADLSQPSGSTENWGCAELCSYVAQARIDILVNNAGFGSFGPFAQLELEQELRILAVNLNAALSLSHAALPYMQSQRRGALLNVASIAGFQPLSYMATYAASKAALYSHSLALRQELAPWGIKVLTVCPGPVTTEFSEIAGIPPAASRGFKDPIETVVRHSLRALLQERSLVIPGWWAKLLALPCRLLPVQLTSWFTAQSLARSGFIRSD